MNHTNYQFPLDDEQVQYRKELMERLSKNSLVQSFLSKYHLDTSFLEKNSGYFQTWLDSLDKCKGCQGLPYCRQRIQGKVKTIVLDESGFLEEVFVSCKLLQEKEKMTSHKKNYRLAHLDQSDYLIDLEKIDLTKESRDYIIAYNQVFDSIDTDKGIYLYGQPGVGKTYLLIALANQYAKAGKRVSFVKVPQMIQDIKQSMFDAEYRLDIINHLKYSEILFLDDLGAEAVSAWTRDEILLPILEFRMNHHYKTYFSSNYKLEELEKQYIVRSESNSGIAAMRIMERIRALANSSEIKGVSRR